MQKYKVDKLLPDKIDSRDLIYTASVEDLPKRVDLRQYAGTIENQGNTGSCVANAASSALELILTRANRFIDLSRLFLYYNLREPYIALKEQDKGSYTRDGFKMATKQGMCPESVWKFDTTKVNTKPTEDAYTEALKLSGGVYERVGSFNVFMQADEQSILLLKAAVASGQPVLIGCKVGRTIYNMAGKLEKQDYKGVLNDNIGGHAMCVVGYDDALGGFIVENSWGKDWGDNGYFVMKYEVVAKDCHDAWVCTEFAGIKPAIQWSDTSPKLVIEPVNKTQYKDEGRAFKLEYNVISGTPPYTATNTVVTNGAGIIKDEYMHMTEGKTIGVVTSTITDSSPLKKQVKIMYMLTYVDSAKPIPKPKPVEPVKPVPIPVDDKKKNKLPLIIGGLIVAAVCAVSVYLELIK